jgi:hypothetical protein
MFPTRFRPSGHVLPPRPSSLPARRPVSEGIGQEPRRFDGTRPPPSRVWCRQLVPSATISVSAAAARTAGPRQSVPDAIWPFGTCPFAFATVKPAGPAPGRRGHRPGAAPRRRLRVRRQRASAGGSAHGGQGRGRAVPTRSGHSGHVLPPRDRQASRAGSR